MKKMKIDGTLDAKDGDSEGQCVKGELKLVVYERITVSLPPTWGWAFQMRSFDMEAPSIY